ncbi:ORF34 [callitrichine gammaherpesvirus 3]|uniref:ORF34 n=1 Tax=callitrichine gammaherpesvirus 3 TaxID=106331 RepID=Q993H6_9GAMA|nr:ORF34 [callitrichine gammaherpesvirus 3]AAK38242.1 ORF34 [callitrichine gammaherpesvirus 3]
MFNMNVDDIPLEATIPVHPTSTSIKLFEILQGKYAYVPGQTLYANLRNPGVFFRQVFVHLFKRSISHCTYDDVLTDWTKFEACIQKRWPREEKCAEAFRESTFLSWETTMRLTTRDLLTTNIYRVVHSRVMLSYERYVDWVCATGMVPVVQKPISNELHQRLKLLKDKCMCHAAGHERTLMNIGEELYESIKEIIETLNSTYIPSFTEVTIEFCQASDQYFAYYRGKRIRLHVLFHPAVSGHTVTFDSPVQRLYHNIFMCYRTLEHAKVCQMLNTKPVKALVGRGGRDMYKDILSHLEQNAQKKDPKKEMLSLLVKLSENKTISGVTDVVEDFITDASNNLVDRNRLFGQPGETTSQGLKRKVSTTVLKCLTEQINEQFDQINSLERERELYLKKIKSIESQLQAHLREHGESPSSASRAGHRADLLTGETMSVLEDIMASQSLALDTHPVGINETVLNSFLSQYVPPFREMTKDLTALWESELFNTFKLTPVVDNQGQRLYVRYSSDTISILLGPFTYLIAELASVELVTDVHASLGFVEIIDELYRNSRLAVYISDLGKRYCPTNPVEQDRHGQQREPGWSHSSTGPYTQPDIGPC